MGKTSKENYEEHGFGLKTVDQIVRKYNGELSIVVNGEKFVDSVFMRTIWLHFVVLCPQLINFYF